MIKKDNNQELLPLVDEEGQVIGHATRGECHDGSKLLHPVVHLHVFDSRGRLYLQQRPVAKTPKRSLPPNLGGRTVGENPSRFA